MSFKSPFTLVKHTTSLSESSNIRSSRRVRLSPDVLRNGRVEAGEVLVVRPALVAGDVENLSLTNGKPESSAPDFVLAVAWPVSGLDPSTAVISPSVLSSLASPPTEGDLVNIVPLANSKLSAAEAVKIAFSWLDANPTDAAILPHVQQALRQIQYLTVGQRIDLAFNGGTRSLRISKIAFASGQHDIGVVTQHTAMVAYKSKAAASQHRTTLSTVSYDQIGGLDKQIEQIRDLVEMPLLRPDVYRHLGLRRPHGILLYGAPGTGKTLLASAVAASLDLPVYSISGATISSPYHGEAEKQLQTVFETATAAGKENGRGSLIILDEVDALAPKREDSGEVERRVVAALLMLMDGLDSKEDASAGRVMVIAATNRPNAIDPALRRPGRFDREIEIGIPDAPARLAILRTMLRRSPHSLSLEAVSDIAARTHGFVGADLASLVHTAGINAVRRATVASALPSAGSDLSSLSLEQVDIDAALLHTRPSAMREVFVETPRVLWSDIGGQETVKQRLREMVEWPLRHPEAFKRLGVRPARGVLLYGPPGCSKTLIARALATEAGLNFIALKGPEVLNKFVGESERTIRETFRKARAAAPSILFIDEIDAIASSRGSSSPVGDGVLTTLLTEMDGVEELIGVTLLAATNRPEIIDAALMRPGRFDRILYVSPPDFSARQAILSNLLGKMAVHADVDVDALAALTDGCSGAEVTSACQDAGLLAMNEDLNVESIRMTHFVAAISAMRRRITPDMLARYEAWRDQVV